MTTACDIRFDWSPDAADAFLCRPASCSIINIGRGQGKWGGREATTQQPQREGNRKRLLQRLKRRGEDSFGINEVLPAQYSLSLSRTYTRVLCNLECMYAYRTAFKVDGESLDGPILAWRVPSCASRDKIRFVYISSMAKSHHTSSRADNNCIFMGKLKTRSLSFIDASSFSFGVGKSMRWPHHRSRGKKEEESRVLNNVRSAWGHVTARRVS